MRHLIILLGIISAITGCTGTQKATDFSSTDRYQLAGVGDTVITQSLFSDKSSSITEENIQKILDGSYQLPRNVRVALINIENVNKKRYYWNDEEYLKTQQSYVDLFTAQIKKSSRVSWVAVIPDLVLPKELSYTTIREAAVRMQADIVVVFAVSSDLYSKYKVFSKTDIKAFATTQVFVLDVRTGLVPLTAVSTRDVVSQKKDGELNLQESRQRIQAEAVLLTINDIGGKIASLLK
jgi:hypothetical protein